MHTEINLLKKQFKTCGYPSWLIDQKVKLTLDKMLGIPAEDIRPVKKVDKAPSKDYRPRWIVLHLPWTGDSANNDVFKLKKLIPPGLKISVAQTVNKLRDLLPSIHPEKVQRPLLTADLVYKYTCNCGRVYIGETMRRLDVRASEHGQEKSKMMEHIGESEACQFDKGNFSVVAKRLKGREARKRCESIYIRYFDRRALTINTCESSRQLQIF